MGAYKKGINKNGAFCVSIDLEKDNYKNENFIAIRGDIRNKNKFTPRLTNEEMLLKSYTYYHKNRKEIEQRTDVSAHNKNAKMGVVRILKWMM